MIHMCLCYSFQLESGYLQHVFNVFERLGYQRVGGGFEGVDWDVLWAHDYPFVTLREHLAHLKPHQRVRIVVNFECRRKKR